MRHLTDHMDVTFTHMVCLCVAGKPSTSVPRHQTTNGMLLELCCALRHHSRGGALKAQKHWDQGSWLSSLHQPHPLLHSVGLSNRAPFLKQNFLSPTPTYIHPFFCSPISPPGTLTHHSSHAFLRDDHPHLLHLPYDVLLYVSGGEISGQCRGLWVKRGKQTCTWAMCGDSGCVRKIGEK